PPLPWSSFLPCHQRRGPPRSRLLHCGGSPARSLLRPSQRPGSFRPGASDAKNLSPIFPPFPPVLWYQTFLGPGHRSVPAACVDIYKRRWKQCQEKTAPYGSCWTLVDGTKCPFTAATGVRIPLGTPIFSKACRGKRHHHTPGKHGF